MDLVVATRNQGKAREFSQLLGDRFTVEPLPEGVALPPEDGATFDENARIKAIGAYRALGSRRHVLADDSGLEVSALGGRPGVYSARFAGPGATDEQNNALLLDELEDAADRSARFVCSLVAALHGPALGLSAPEDPVVVVARGTVEGEIAQRPRGSLGFGYDPLFRPVGWERTVAEVAPNEKAAVSHRGAAVRKLLRVLRERGVIE